MMTLNTLIVGFSLLTPAGVAVPFAVTDAAVAVASENLTGAVHSINWESKTFDVVIDKDETTKQVAWNDQTSFMLDGEKSTAKEVLVAMGKVTVNVGDDSYATTVSRTTK